MENLKYNQRNISGFVYDYNTANRAVCPISTIFEIFKTAISQGMKNYSDFSVFAQYPVLQAINEPITILKELISSTLSTYEEVPLESNPMLTNFIVGKDDARFDTNVNENIEKMFTAKKQKAKSENNKGLPIWGKCLLFAGLFFGTVFGVGVIEAALGIL